MVFVIILFLMVIVVVVFTRRKLRQYSNFPDKWRKVLYEKIVFYRNLDDKGKKLFEKKMLRFLNRTRITGVNTELVIEDKLLVASSAVIPVFGFPEWEYSFLDEVLIYPDAFDKNFGEASDEEYITGMVGNGAMEGKMILSKPSLHLGFDNDRDKKNVGIHEFVHLIDKEDGELDGLPMILNEQPYMLPWLELTRKKTADILNENSDINPYGTTNQKEFLAVASEYFFERPHLLKAKHPELYKYLSLAFNYKPHRIIPKRVRSTRNLSRNSPCICGSGEKYKNCCLD